MKKIIFSFLLCLLFGLCVALVSCEKPEPDPVQPEQPEQPVIDDPVEEVSIIGHWKLYSAMQVTPLNQSDATNFYGTNFQVIFEEDGTLITTNGVNSTQMQWALDGDQLSFIQAEGMDPVLYSVLKLTADTLSIENGAGTDFVTTMNFIRQ